MLSRLENKGCMQEPKRSLESHDLFKKLNVFICLSLTIYDEYIEQVKAMELLDLFILLLTSLRFKDG